MKRPVPRSAAPRRRSCTRELDAALSARAGPRLVHARARSSRRSSRSSPPTAAPSTASASATASTRCTWCCAATASAPATRSSSPANTFIATWLAVSAPAPRRCPSSRDEAHHDARPRDRRGRDHRRAPAAIMPVHLYGQPADMDAIDALAERHGLPCSRTPPRPTAPACTASRVGSLGDAAGLQLLPGQEPRRARRRRRGHHRRRRARRPRARAAQLRLARRTCTCEVGYNSRLDELQAAVLRVKLAAPGRVERAPRGGRRPLPRRSSAPTRSRLPGVPRRRASRAGTCSSSAATAATRCAATSPPPASRPSSTTRSRPTARAPTPATPLAAAHLPVSDRIAERSCRLPIGPHLSDADVDRVIEAVASF